MGILPVINRAVDPVGSQVGESGRLMRGTWLESRGRLNLLFFDLTPSALLLIKSILPPFNYHRRLTRFLGSDATWLQSLTGKWCRIKIIKKGINRLEYRDWPVKSNHPSLINSWANQVQVNLSQGSWLAQEKN